MPETLPPPHRVQKDHTCRSLGLEGLDLCHMCDQCRHFQMRIDGLCGWHPEKFQKEKCEKPWVIPNGITDKTQYKTIEKKRRIIEILIKYNYKVVDDNCDKKIESRLISVKNYRDKWNDKKYPHKTNSILVESSDDEAANKKEHALEEVIQNEIVIPQRDPNVLKANTIFQP